MNIFNTELDGKRLGLLHELVPTSSVIAHFLNSTYGPAGASIKEVEGQRRELPILRYEIDQVA